MSQCCFLENVALFPSSSVCYYDSVWWETYRERVTGHVNTCVGRGYRELPSHSNWPPESHIRHGTQGPNPCIRECRLHRQSLGHHYRPVSTDFTRYVSVVTANILKHTNRFRNLLKQLPVTLVTHWWINWAGVWKLLAIMVSYWHYFYFHI